MWLKEVTFPRKINIGPNYWCKCLFLFLSPMICYIQWMRLITQHLEEQSDKFKRKNRTTTLLKISPLSLISSSILRVSWSLSFDCLGMGFSSSIEPDWLHGPPTTGLTVYRLQKISTFASSSMGLNWIPMSHNHELICIYCVFI